MTKKISITVFMALLVCSCNQTFEPNGSYEDRMIVFSILRTESDTQYVRVYETYDPNLHNPLTHTTDTEITDATVLVSDGTDTIAFHDTVITRYDTTTLYGKYLHTYTAYHFVPKANTTYTLSISSPTKGNVSAHVSTFPSGAVYASNKIYQTLAAPQSSEADTSIIVTVQLSSEVPAYMVRLMLKYRQYVSGQWVLSLVEVPIEVVEGVSYNDYLPTYPSVMRRGQYATMYAGQERISFSKDAYIALVKNLKYTIGPSKIEFDGAYFILNQFDQNVYSYFSATNQVSDNISIRLDQIDFSNIQGGYGLFGLSTHSESFYLKLPIDIDVQ
ncbi:MAG: DUF4249 family protein [Bacteroidota bacterium]